MTEKKTATTKEVTARAYKTLGEIMNAPARESMPIIARVAPAIESIATKTGILSLMFDNAVVTATNAAAMQKLPKEQQAKVRGDLMKIGENVTIKLVGSIGSCMPEYQEILAAINGITVDELLDNYTAKQIIEMIKTVVSDKDFLTSVRTLVN